MLNPGSNHLTKIEAILKSNASTWLKGAIKELLMKDPCAAESEAEILAVIMRQRAIEILSLVGGGPHE